MNTSIKTILVIFTPMTSLTPREGAYNYELSQPSNQ